jgi:hypothetical protein
MGTSTSQRSPATAAWDRVRELYRSGVTDPASVAQAIAGALDGGTRAAMSGLGVAICLDALLLGSDLAARSTSEAPLLPARSSLSVASAIRHQAENRLATQGGASRYADLALDALGSAALAVVGASAEGWPGGGGAEALATLGAYRREGRLHDLARQFCGHDADRCFRHFVARDLSEFVGTEAWPTVQAARRLHEDVGTYCRTALRGLDYAAQEGRLQDALRTGGSEGLAQLQGALAHQLQGGLRVLSGG